MAESKLIVSASPHLRSKENVDKVMRDVLIALVPTTVMGIIFFGLSTIGIILTCVLFSMLAEAAFQKLMGKKVTIKDGSAAVTGLLLALILPAKAPLWMAAVGAVLAIGLGKQVYGGLGNNPFNPALIGRTILLISWPVQMTSYLPTNFARVDATSFATPLGILKGEGIAGLAKAFANKAIMYQDLFIGNVGGCIGEVSALAVLIGGIYLLYKGHITWHIPLSYIASAFILSGVFYLYNPEKFADPIFHILAGGLFLGVFFMATDMVTSPITAKGMIIFGTGCGVLTILIRLFGGYPEGVMFSILIMNAVTPLLDRWKWTHPKKFGFVKEQK